jgi:hypothetical protein
MQELRFVAVSEDGSYAVLAVPGRSGRFILPIDERLRAVAMGQTSRLAQYEIEVESPLRPKEIQARIRAGETAEEIADAAGIPVERVRWFEGPVLAERAYIADQAQAASVRRAGDSAGPGPRLGDIVPERLTASGADPEDGQWDSRKRGDGNWQVTLTFPSGGRLHVAEWVFDSRRRHVMPDDDNAARLSLPESELPPEPVSLPGEATVTPLAPRLGAAAGMGGGMGGGGFSGGGSGVGVRSFRPERSVIPDRSLGGDRSLADRPLSPPPGPVHAPAAASAGDRPVMPERSAMSHSPAAPTAPPPSAQQRAPEQPAPAGAVPVTAPPYVFEDLPSPAPPAPSPAGERAGHTASRRVVFEDPEPAFRDEQLELASAPSDTAAPAGPSAPMSTAAPAGPAPSAGAAVPVAEPLPQPPAPPAPPEERLRQPEAASAREFAPSAPAAAQTPQPDPGTAAQHVADAVAITHPESATVTPPAPSAPVQASETTSRAAAPPASTAPAGQAPAVPSSPAALPTPGPAAPRVSAAPPAAAEPGPAAAPITAARQVTEATRSGAAARPEPATAAQPTTIASAEPVTASVTAESPAASATTTPAQSEPVSPPRPEGEPAAAATPPPEPTRAPDPAAIPPAQAESAEEQSARQRPGSKKSPKGRRSSVPSWDEIMLGSSRQRD